MALVNATVIDVAGWGRSGADIDSAVVIIRGDTIEAVGRSGVVPIPAGAVVVDLRGKYIVPGYIDGFGVINNQAYADAYLTMGVTSIISAADERRGPLFRDAQPSPVIHVLESVGDEAGDTARHLQDLEALHEQGVDIALLKYQLRPDQVKALIERAGDLGMATVGELGHTSYAEAVRMGLNAVVHTTRYSLDIAPRKMRSAVADAPFSDDLESAKWRYYLYLSKLRPGDSKIRDHARRLSAGTAALMPTAALIYLDQSFAENPWREPVARIIDPEDVNRPAEFHTGRHVEGGVTQTAYSAVGAAEMRLDSTYAATGAHYLAGSGTDTWGTLPGISLHQEIDMLVRIGLTPRQALAAATANFEAAMPSVFRKVGRVREGYRADLVILGADPRVDHRHLKFIDDVYLAGERLDRTKLVSRHVPHPDGLLLDARTVIWPEEMYETGTQVFKREFAYLDSVRAWDITYLSDGLQVKGYLVEPAAVGRYPGVIVNRGGNREFAALTPRSVAQILARVASWGYVAVGSQYRGNAGGEGQEEFGGAEVDDVLNLIPLLESRPAADASRLGMYGGSRGGMMTYLALARTDRIKAAVIRSGVSDLLSGRRARPEMDSVYMELIPGYNGENDRPLIERSAVRWVDRLCKTTPILLLQGTADWRVEPQECLDMAKALQAAKHPYRLVMLEGADHRLSEHTTEAYRQIRGWLDRYVKNGEALPNLEPHGE
jgi:dienelactone hydrolase